MAHRDASAYIGAMANDLTSDGHEIEARAQRSVRLALISFALVLASACGYLWMRYGIEVFLNAAQFVWTSCF